MFTPLPQEQLKEMRFLSNSTGEVLEAQIEQLKGIAQIVFDGPVKVTINKDGQDVFTEVPHQPTAATSKWPEIVKEILGQKWAINLRYSSEEKQNVKRNSKNTRKRRSDSRRKRKSGTLRRVKRR